MKVTMNSLRTPLLVFSFLTVIGAATFYSPPSYAGKSATMDEHAVYDYLVDQSANSCMHYSGVRDERVIRRISIATAERMIDRNLLACPDTAISKDSPVVWYGNHKAMAWNPDVKEAPELMYGKLDPMAHDDTFPPDILEWSASGEVIKNAIVPEFVKRPDDSKKTEQ